MAAAFRAKTSGTAAVGVGSITLAKPTGTAAGDGMIAAISQDTLFASTITWPAAFAEITNSPKVASSPDGQTLSVAKQIAGGSEPANYTISSSLTNEISAFVASFSGTDGTTLLDVTSSGTVQTGSSTPASFDAATITTVTDGCLLVHIGASDLDVAGTETWTDPTGFVNRVTQGSARNFMSLWASDKTQTTQGATGTISGSDAFTGGGSCGRISFLLALRPAAGAAVDQPPQEAWDFSGDDAGWCDESATIEATTQSQPVDAASAPPSMPQDPEQFDDFYDDPWVDQIELLPVQANAPPDGLLQQDGWGWDHLGTEADVDELVIDDFANFDADGQRDDAWPWDDDVFDEWDGEGAPVGADTVAVAPQPTEDSWPWHDESADDLQVDDAALVADAIASAEPLPVDVWTWDDEVEDWRQSDDTVFGAPVAAEQPTEDSWPWHDESADDDLQVDDAALVADAIASAEPLPVDAWAWDDEVEERLVDESAPVDSGDMPSTDAWDWNEEVSDHGPDDQALSIDLPVTVELLPDDAWDWFDEGFDAQQQADVVLMIHAGVVPTWSAGGTTRIGGQTVRRRGVSFGGRRID